MTEELMNGEARTGEARTGEVRTPPSASSPAVLLVAASPTVLLQMERLCAQAGLPTVAAATLAEARQALAQRPTRPLGAMVLDAWLPDGRGADLLAELRGDLKDAAGSSPAGNLLSDGTAPAYPYLPILSIGTADDAESDAEPSAPQLPGGPVPDAAVPKALLVSHLVDELRAQMRIHAAAGSLGRVLVVDDSRTYREQLRASLESAGYSVLLAETGEEGVRCALENPPDAMLVDSMLPGINGAAVIRRIRGESATRRTPCLLLTASEDAREELEALEAGADSFVRKHEDLAVILARLAGVLRSASTPDATSLAALPQLPRRVVLIGHTPGPLDTLGTVLLEEGCETLSLIPAQATLERCAAIEPDILLFAAPTDERMLTFCRSFKLVPALRNTRLLLLDTEPGRNVAAAAIGAGADDYLPAASDRAVILARAKSQLRRKRVEDENRGLREHILRQELENAAQRALADARTRHADEMRVAYGLAERKAHEAERARLELEQITEGIPQIVWTSDAEGRNTRFNRRWQDYTGLPHRAVTNRIWRKAIHREDVSRALRDWVASFRGGLPYTSEYRLCGADNNYRWFLVRAIPLADETGAIDRWFGTCTDIHDQKLSEEALRRTEKLAATGRLAASIAHEINNPLEAVTNLLYLIEGNVRDDAETHGYITTAQKELDRVAQISKKTLAFYRESTNAAPVDLCALVAEVVDIYSVRLERKSIALRIENTCDRHPEGLAGELRQVISNLVTNAIDASDSHSALRIRLRPAHRWDEARNEVQTPGVRISIADRGHGIPAALVADLFKPFVTTKGQKGTGLGLWLSQSIVDRHGGTLRVRSSAGARHGTCFSVFLPMRLPASPGEADSMGTMLRTIGKELLRQS